MSVEGKKQSLEKKCFHCLLMEAALEAYRLSDNLGPYRSVKGVWQLEALLNDVGLCLSLRTMNMAYKRVNESMDLLGQLGKPKDSDQKFHDILLRIQEYLSHLLDSIVISSINLF